MLTHQDRELDTFGHQNVSVFGQFCLLWAGSPCQGKQNIKVYHMLKQVQEYTTPSIFIVMYGVTIVNYDCRRNIKNRKKKLN